MNQGIPELYCTRMYSFWWAFDVVFDHRMGLPRMSYLIYIFIQASTRRKPARFGDDKIVTSSSRKQTLKFIPCLDNRECGSNWKSEFEFLSLFFFLGLVHVRWGPGFSTSLSLLSCPSDWWLRMKALFARDNSPKTREKFSNKLLEGGKYSLPSRRLIITKK